MSTAAELLSRKGDLRREAFARRRAVRSDAAQDVANTHLFEAIAAHPKEAIVSGYMAIQTEIDPMPAMTRLYQAGHRICLPVIQGHAQPLLFREWSPGSPLIEGDFGALIPRGGAELDPQILITPLVAFDSAGNRMGYGGGFFDRTLSRLRAQGAATAIGFAFSGQELPQVPTEATDEPLDAIVTEAGHRAFA